MKVTVKSASAQSSTRIEGLDVARALALFGMILVHFHLVVAGGASTPTWLAGLIESLQGRAAATFVVLAGMGASLGGRRAAASKDAGARRGARMSLARRGLFLFVLGLLFLPVWPADILHSYGVWLSAGALLLFAGTWTLAAVAVLCGLVSALFIAGGSFFDHWNLLDLTYSGLWTPKGFMRNLFLDGWNPFFPWFGLYVYGMVLGRQPLGEAGFRRRALMASIAVGATVAALAWALAPAPFARPDSLLHLFATTATPPTPGFLLFGAAAATSVILVCIELALRLPRTFRPLALTGQLALTLYLGHIFVGLGTLEALGRLEGQSLGFAAASGAAFFLLAVLFSGAWRWRFQRGPLEALMRRVCR